MAGNYPRQNDRIPSICFIDTEFNARDFDGQNDGYQEITEIGAVIFQNGIPVDSFQIYCSIVPTHTISERSAKITGITEELLAKEGVPFPKALKELRSFLYKYDVQRIYAFGTADRIEMKATAKLNGITNMTVIRKIQNVYPTFERTLKLEEVFSLTEICDACCVKHGNKRAHSARYDAEDTGLAYYNMKQGKINGFVIRKIKQRKQERAAKKVVAQQEDAVNILLAESEA